MGGHFLLWLLLNLVAPSFEEFTIRRWSLIACELPKICVRTANLVRLITILCADLPMGLDGQGFDLNVLSYCTVGGYN